MRHRILPLNWIVVLCLAAAIPTELRAQTVVNSEYPLTGDPKRSKTEFRKPEDSESIQLSTAISIVMSLVNESERFKDQTLRVRTEARSADALWNVDESLARRLLLQAWEIAERLDDASLQATEEAKKAALRPGGSSVTMIPRPTSLRSEILTVAARRDSTLGNLFLAKLAEATKQKRESEDDTKSLFRDPTEPGLAIAKRFEVALQLLNGGDVRQAIAFAEPSLVYATSPGIIFLCTLRQKDHSTADRIYARLLGRALSDPNADATTVSLLSSYVLTPNYVVTATRNGRISNRFGSGPDNHHPSSELRAGFFSVAATILLRPLPPADQDRTVAGRAGTYFTIARLLPMFQVYAPNYVTALNTQLAILTMDAPETFRNGQDGMLSVGLRLDRGERDVIGEILEKVGSASSSVERDSLYITAIREGASKNDTRIRQFADKIEDEKVRDRARSFADFVVMRIALNKRDESTGLAIVRDGYLEPLHRVWAMGEIARLLLKRDSARRLQLLEDAAVLAQRIPRSDPDRAYALSYVAGAFFTVDRQRSWSLSSDAVEAANAVPGFTGEDTKLTVRLRARNAVSMISVDEPSFNIANLLEVLATDDLQLALSSANRLTGEHTHAAASLGVARSVLSKQKPTPQK